MLRTSILVLALLVSPGCLALAVGAAAGGGMAWYKGAMVATVEASPEVAMDAARRTVEDMKLVLVSVNASALDGELIARTAGNDNVSITARRQSTGASELSIRIGVLGDESMSLALYEGIRKRLGDG